MQLLRRDDDDAVDSSIRPPPRRFQNTWLPATLLLIIGGFALGLVMPRNVALPDASWRTLSNVVGYTYFLAWSASFYPQLLSNYRRGTTTGLSVDFCVLNVLGYTCYTIYTTEFLWNEDIRETYRQQRPPSAEEDYGMSDGTTTGKGESTVQGNDVAFAIHALTMASVMLCQVGYYDGFAARPPSKRVLWAGVGALVFCILYVTFTWMRSAMIAGTLTSKGVDWLGFLYVLGTIKICVTVAKYVPQVVLNASRKSTVGWNVVNVLLDLTGGVLSFVQLVGDCADVGDWTGITGNPAKFALSFVTIGFDLVFLVQHYILYPEHGDKSNYSPIDEEIEIE